MTWCKRPAPHRERAPSALEKTDDTVNPADRRIEFQHQRYREIRHEPDGAGFPDNPHGAPVRKEGSSHRISRKVCQDRRQRNHPESEVTQVIAQRDLLRRQPRSNAAVSRIESSKKGTRNGAEHEKIRGTTQDDEIVLATRIAKRPVIDRFGLLRSRGCRCRCARQIPLPIVYRRRHGAALLIEAASWP